ncbi:MAG: hypothetical protein QGI21_06785 [Candidatus Poseidoniaceae archaeon]|jgi:hypothetical protein|nr:hypothetical protein [Candidatus Poseidoniaceae archaeon]
MSWPDEYRIFEGTDYEKIDCKNVSTRILDVHDVEVIDITSWRKKTILRICNPRGLKEINFKSSIPNGFLELFLENKPLLPLQINGKVKTVNLTSGSGAYVAGFPQTDRTLVVDSYSGCHVTNNSKTILRNDSDSLLMHNIGEQEVLIQGDWKSINFVDCPFVNSITIKSDIRMHKIYIDDCPNLKEIRIRGMVYSLYVDNCENIANIVGYGDNLILNKCLDNLSVNGFWIETPMHFADKRDASINDPYSELSIDVLKTCEDIDFVTITPREYEGGGGIIEWSEVFGVDTATLSLGTSIPNVLNYILSTGDSGISAFTKWCKQAVGLWETYKGMRIICALVLNGISVEKIMIARHSLCEENRVSRNIVNTVDDDSMSSRIKTSFFNKFHRGKRGLFNFISDSPRQTEHIPFHRLDVEIGACAQALGIDYPYSVFNSISLRGMQVIGQSSVMGLYSAIHHEGRSESAQERIKAVFWDRLRDSLAGPRKGLVDQMLGHFLSSPLCNEWSVSRLCKLVKHFSKLPPGDNALIIAALIQEFDSIDARMYLKTILLEESLPFELLTILNPIGLGGQRAFITGKVAKLEFPILRRMDNNRK